jgi:hypothetical protein
MGRSFSLQICSGGFLFGRSETSLLIINSLILASILSGHLAI